MPEFTFKLWGDKLKLKIALKTNEKKKKRKTAFDHFVPAMQNALHHHTVDVRKIS